MSSMKRSASASPGWTARPSAFHASVTLYESADTPNSDSALRRSKRLKVSSDADASSSIKEEESAPSITAKTKRQSKARAVATESLVAASTPTTAKAKRIPSPRKAKPIPTALDVPHPAPARWREAYDTIREMRARTPAPVDTMGCEQAQLKEKDPKNQRFSTLVSLMLSSQTKDEVTDAAVAKLREAVGGCLSVDAVLQANDDAVCDAICKVGFWRRKTQYIKQTAQRLRDDFDSDVPKTVDELCSLPGVGPKMAFLALQVAWKLNVGIGVDVHVHRITNRLGWHTPPTKTPEQTRLNLQSWLPLELHPEINLLLVGFGQTICTPVSPRCDVCDLSAGLCPSARKVSKSTGKRVLALAHKSGPKVDIALELDEDSAAASTDPAISEKPSEDTATSGIE